MLKNRNKAGMTLAGDKTAANSRNEVWLKRGAQKSGGNSGRPTQNKGSKNCTAKAAAHGTARQGSPCTEKAKRD